MPEAQAIAWIADVLNGLEYLHTFRPPIIHRDIKPANIKIRSDGKVFLVDFGIAKVFDPTQKTRTGARAVTPGYSPTEQYGFGITDARSDLYAVGATLYFILTAQVPPEATNLASNLQSLTPPSRFGVPISSQVEQAILRAMAVTPQQRFQSARDFRDALDPARATQRALPTQSVQSPNVVAPTAMASPQVAPIAIPQAGSSLKPISTPTPIPKSVSAPVPAINVVYASWGRRAVAYLIDGFLLYILGICIQVPFMVLIGGVSSASSSSSASAASMMLSCLSSLVSLGINAAYYIGLIASSGQTLGKKAMQIRVITKSGNPVSFGQAIARYIGYLVSTLMLFIGFLWPLWDDQKQAIHDKMAGTIVVRV
jgi:serine/threonine protein kinase